MEGSIWKGALWGNKGLGNACVGLSFKNCLLWEDGVCHGGFWRDLISFVSVFNLLFLFYFILFLREFKLGEVGNLQKRQGLEGIILEFDVLDMGPSYLRKKKGN